ncbi:sulfatase-like hydrolase/transferase [Methylosarcina fibrata]|uniref:sulfatase-like hydrolase/transferase n=1 Tax=Methylosarcina fibrata TaxID=105972 RepID=UPI000378667B|nr:sulfatase-like hydrolase/transferase [Methylosarcina fibrata]
MKNRDDNPVSESREAGDEGMNPSRRRFLQESAALSAAGLLGLPQAGLTDSPQSAAVPGDGRNRPNFLILMCDEMRYPPFYESASTKAFRRQYLKTQNFLRRNGVEFHRHYAASVACSPSRASLYTGQYPSLHGVTQTTGAAKDAFDPDVFWLDPNSVPTMGDYFRAAGYSTYWRGKWHASDADMIIPGTKSQLVSYDEDGNPDPVKEALYQSADRLGGFGFSGWIGPEPHGRAPLNSGSSVPAGQQGRDVGFAQQAQSLIRQLDHDNSASPWLIVSSFVNPHDITLWGLYTNVANLGFEFDIEEDVVPLELFDPVLFNRTMNDDLGTKPSAQASYQTSYAKWMQPILDDPATLERYYRYYYQLHKNVDEQMGTVLQALLASRFKDNTYVVFLSDHGDFLGSHHNMHQKWYTAYDEAIRVPLIVWHGGQISAPRSIRTLTSHIDMLPTLLGLAGIAQEPVRASLAETHSDALPLVGRDLSSLILGSADPRSVNDPLYFMTDDDPSRGLNQNNWTGIEYNSVIQPNHIETVIARLNGEIWKYSRYFDNPQFWTTPGTPNDPDDPNYPNVDDVVSLNKVPLPTEDGTYEVPFQVTVKHTPVTEEFEMYNVSLDPMELNNLYNDGVHTEQQQRLARILEQQRCTKRLTPSSGTIPGQPDSCAPG